MGGYSKRWSLGSAPQSTRGMQNKAVVVGALGVIGRYIAERLVEKADWQVVGLSRRKAPDGPRYRHIAVDLLDVESTKRELAELTDVTHIFYAAFQATPGSELCVQYRPQPRNVGQLGHRHSACLTSSKTCRACYWDQILRRAPRTVENTDAGNRSASHAAQLLLRSD